MLDKGRYGNQLLEGFTQATLLPAEGARVAIINCERCGCSLLLHPRETISLVDRHRAWHDHLDALEEQLGRVS